MTDFPPPDAHVSAVLAGGSGFVAIGYHGDNEYPCDPLTVDGRAWTSTDGEQWDESGPAALDELGDHDRGWLTQLDENELLYESRRGQTVNLRPSQEAEASGPCA